MYLNLSLNEVEATARKAARGAGYEWSIADEAGRATRWLCEHGLDGCKILLALLRMKSADQFSLFPPQVSASSWQSVDGKVCPIITGTALSDFTFQLTQASTEIRDVPCPAMLLPFVADAAAICKRPVEIAWEDFSWISNSPIREKETDVQFQDFAPIVTVSIAADEKMTAPEPNRHSRSRAHVSQETWEKLNAFAHCTYAPATEASRLRGAGAGLSDND